MWIDHQFFPFEILRNIKNFIGAFKDDYDLRFSDSRERRIRLISHENPDEKSLQGLSDEWRQAPECVSYLDWNRLMEWSEEYRRLNLKYHIHSALRKLMHEELVPTHRAILNRLRDIDQKLNSIPNAARASFLEMLEIRWSVPALVEETEYLIGRLNPLKP
jgi:hypothetical protein